MTAELIFRSQGGNSDSTIALINKFNPLLKKYSYQLHYDDAYNDLLVDFIDLLHNIKLDSVYHKCEGGLVSYISKSIQSSYIKKLAALKKLRNFIPESNFAEEELYSLEAVSAVNDIYFEYEFPGIERVLTKPETDVIKMIYLMEYSVCETAQELGTSRQAVNQMKNRALKKLKTQFLDKP